MSATNDDPMIPARTPEFPPPDIAITVITETDFASAVNRKVEAWLKAGVRLVWVVDPFSKFVHRFDRDHPNVSSLCFEADTLSGDPVLPGFSIPVADLFRLPTGATV